MARFVSSSNFRFFFAAKQANEKVEQSHASENGWFECQIEFPLSMTRFNLSFVQRTVENAHYILRLSAGTRKTILHLSILYSLVFSWFLLVLAFFSSPSTYLTVSYNI